MSVSTSTGLSCDDSAFDDRAGLCADTLPADAPVDAGAGPGEGPGLDEGDVLADSVGVLTFARVDDGLAAWVPADCVDEAACDEAACDDDACDDDACDEAAGALPCPADDESADPAGTSASVSSSPDCCPESRERAGAGVGVGVGAKVLLSDDVE